MVGNTLLSNLSISSALPNWTSSINAEPSCAPTVSLDWTTASVVEVKPQWMQAILFVKCTAKHHRGSAWFFSFFQMCMFTGAWNKSVFTSQKDSTGHCCADAIVPKKWAHFATITATKHGRSRVLTCSLSHTSWFPHLFSNYLPTCFISPNFSVNQGIFCSSGGYKARMSSSQAISISHRSPGLQKEDDPYWPENSHDVSGNHPDFDPSTSWVIPFCLPHLQKIYKPKSQIIMFDRFIWLLIIIVTKLSVSKLLQWIWKQNSLSKQSIIIFIFKKPMIFFHFVLVSLIFAASISIGSTLVKSGIIVLIGT